MTEENFKEEIFSFTIYPLTMLQNFFDYWSEPNKKGKMRFELEKTWELGRRLKRWSDNDKNWKNATNQTNSKLGTSAARIAALKTWGFNDDGSWGIKRSPESAQN